MQLYRIQLRPLTPWITPWQADTLTGLLCLAASRRGEGAWVDREITEPALLGKPPFILSDACPGNLLPCPHSLKLKVWPEIDQKLVRQAQWMTREGFLRTRRGDPPLPTDFLSEAAAFSVFDRVRNTLNRKTSFNRGRGGVFVSSEVALHEEYANLTVYALTNESFVSHLNHLFEVLAETGFGADVAVGRGQFEIVAEFKVDDLGNGPLHRPNSIVSLSTFHVGPDDPSKGAWEAFIKFGKLAPDFGLDNVSKRPLVMFRAGATFESDNCSTLGRGIAASEILSGPQVEAIHKRGKRFAHLAFGLPISGCWLPPSFSQRETG